jgi:hypothetical protein
MGKHDRFHQPVTPQPSPVVPTPPQQSSFTVDFMMKAGVLAGKPMYFRNIPVIGGGVLLAWEGGGMEFIKDVIWDELKKDFKRI